MPNRKSLLNWKNIVSSLLVAGIIAGTPFVYGWISSVNAMVNEMAQVQTMQEAVDETRSDIRELLAEVRGYRFDQLTVTGWARIQQGGTECCIRVNTMSKADEYANFEKARITNLSHAESPSTIVNISGTFRDADGSYLAVLSGVAAARIEAGLEDRIDIRIEPVEKK